MALVVKNPPTNAAEEPDGLQSSGIQSQTQLKRLGTVYYRLAFTKLTTEVTKVLQGEPKSQFDQALLIYDH